MTDSIASPRVMPRLVSLRLLAKYIDHVKTLEGTSFLHHRESWSEFTDAEWALLQAIEAQSDGR